MSDDGFLRASFDQDLAWPDLPEPWRVCTELAWEAYCEGSLAVGAAVFDEEGRLLSIGRNQRYGDHARDRPGIGGHRLAHAELNALLALDLERIERHTSKIYTTVEPCPLCIGAICMSGLKEIHYASRDPWAGSVNLLDATPYLRWKAMRAYGPLEGLLEDAMFALRVDVHLRSGHPRASEVIERWREALPDSIEAAEAIMRSGLLLDCRKKSVPAGVAYDRLFHALRALPRPL